MDPQSSYFRVKAQESGTRSLSGTPVLHRRMNSDGTPSRERKHRIRNYFWNPDDHEANQEHKKSSYSDDEDDKGKLSSVPLYRGKSKEKESKKEDPKEENEKKQAKDAVAKLIAQEGGKGETIGRIKRADTAPTSRFKGIVEPDHVPADLGSTDSPLMSRMSKEPINPANPLNVLQNAALNTSAARANAALPSLFQKILNFRDICEGDPTRVKHGRIFRSGLIHAATAEDFQLMIQKYGIKTTIDFRSSDEIRQHPSAQYEKFFPTNRALLGKSRCRVHCPLWKVTMNFKILIEAKKYKLIGQITKAFATGQRELGIKLLLGEMNEIKLPGMYRCFVKYAQPEIKDALDIMSDPNNYPILIHCSLGKDRTGTMSALVSDIIGMDRATIVREYAKSAKNLFPCRDEMIKNLKRYYFEEWLADSPPEVMEETFKYLDTQYGSVEQFLQQIGFDRSKQKKLREAMMA